MWGRLRKDGSASQRPCNSICKTCITLRLEASQPASATRSNMAYKDTARSSVSYIQKDSKTWSKIATVDSKTNTTEAIIYKYHNEGLTQPCSYTNIIPGLIQHITRLTYASVLLSQHILRISSEWCRLLRITLNQRWRFSNLYLREISFDWAANKQPVATGK